MKRPFGERPTSDLADEKLPQIEAQARIALGYSTNGSRPNGNGSQVELITNGIGEAVPGDRIEAVFAEVDWGQQYTRLGLRKRFLDSVQARETFLADQTDEEQQIRHYTAAVMNDVVHRQMDAAIDGGSREAFIPVVAYDFDGPVVLRAVECAAAILKQKYGFGKSDVRYMRRSLQHNPEAEHEGVHPSVSHELIIKGW